MFCQNCGSQMEDGAKFCENCGAPVEAAAAAADAGDFTAETVENVTGTAEVVEEPAYTYEQPVPQQTNTYNNANSYANYAQAAPVEGGKKGFAIASMICGIVSLVCCCMGWTAFALGAAAVALGIVAMVKAFSGRGMALTGIITGAIGIILGLIIGISSAAGSSLVEEYGDEFIPGFEDIMDDIDL